MIWERSINKEQKKGERSDNRAGAAQEAMLEEGGGGEDFL